MAGFTYSGLKTAVQNYLDNDETTFTSTLDTFIQQTEERILKSVQLPVFRKNATGSGSSGNTYLATPSDYLSPYSLAVVDGDSNYTYSPAVATTGEPLYYAQFDDDTFILAPTPNSNFTFELHYFYRPASLTAAGDSGTTWLSTNASNAMLYGCLVEGTIFMKSAPDEIMVYDQKFKEALATLKALGESKDVRDEARYDNIRMAPQ